ncbi:MAG: DUF5991 domain-containing protein [Lacibacter sp.]
MKSTYINSFLVAFICTLFSSCSLNKSKLNPWIGTYLYEETPIKSIGGSSMVMSWSLEIIDTSNQIKGFLGVNGQQTFMKINTKLSGNTDSIAVIYETTADGISDSLKSGDTLFILKKENNQLTTVWKLLQPGSLKQMHQDVFVSRNSHLNDYSFIL